MTNEPTPDTPQEREDKADVLARELRHFRLETRVFYMIVLIFLALKEIW